MVKVVAYVLRVVQENLRSLKVGVDLKLSQVEYFNLVLPRLYILPIEDSLLEQVIKGVPQLYVEVARGRQDEDVGALREYSEKC